MFSKLYNFFIKLVSILQTTNRCSGEYLLAWLCMSFYLDHMNTYQSLVFLQSWKMFRSYRIWPIERTCSWTCSAAACSAPPRCRTAACTGPPPPQLRCRAPGRGGQTWRRGRGRVWRLPPPPCRSRPGSFPAMSLSALNHPAVQLSQSVNMFLLGKNTLIN